MESRISNYGGSNFRFRKCCFYSVRSVSVESEYLLQPETMHVINCWLVLYLGLDFYIPMSLLDTNMQRAHTRNAVNIERFYMRAQPKSECASCSEEAKSAIKELTVQEVDVRLFCFGATYTEQIMCGEDVDGGFPGLLSYVSTYLDEIQCDQESRQHIDEYVDFIEVSQSCL